LASKTVSVSADDALAQARKLQAQGRLTQAATICEAILKAQPNNLNALYLRGVLKLQQGEYAAAKTDLETAANFNSSSSELLVHLGATYLYLGEYRVAKTTLEKAIKLDPKSVPALLNLSTALQHLQNYERALDTASEAVQIAPDNPSTRITLAVALMATKQFRSARNEFLRALELAPGSYMALNNLSELAFHESRFEEAIDICERAERLTPNNPKILQRKARALVHLGRSEQAQECFNHLEASDPEYIQGQIAIAEAHRLIGEAARSIEILSGIVLTHPEDMDVLKSIAAAYADNNDAELARSTQKQILEQDPDNISALCELCRFDDGIDDRELEAHLNKLSKNPDILPSNDSLIDFGLARINKRQGNLDRHFHYLRSANEKKKAETGYQFEKDQSYFSEIRRVFETFMGKDEQAFKPPKRDRTPLFVIGMPRSGTTLTEQILSAHTEVHGAGELRLLEQSLRTFFTLEANETQPIQIQDLIDVEKNYHAVINHFGQNQPIITDKMPLNFRFVGFVSIMFPDAKIVHLNRDPRAVCWSIYSRNFAGTGNGYANDFDDLARFYKLYLDLMAYWRQALPGKIYDLNYEALTLDQETETRKLLEYCELDWQDECLDFHKNNRPVRTASGQQVRQKMYQGSSDAWRRYEPHLTELLDGLQKYGVPLPE
jgi:tetratricopeptide (TPR) repeat protein